MSRSKHALKELATPAQHIYQAATPGYTSNFSRDSFTYGLLAGDLDALAAQVQVSADLQGTKADPDTGEEPGKIHHEYPGVRLRGRSTMYNACDTTALFLLAIARLAKRGNNAVLQQYEHAIERAIGYITAHVHDGIFFEDTKQSGASQFALKVTYWKDSQLNDGKQEPHYPIAYSLVHFQNKAALQEIGQLTGVSAWQQLAQKMTRMGLTRFWAGDHFIVAEDGTGQRFDTPSSDSLHALLYLEPWEIDKTQAEAIERYSEQLVTDGGYRPAIQQVGDMDTYHTHFVWVHEQALLHAAASRHGLKRTQAVAARVMPALEKGFPELLDPDKSFSGAGNPTQLWSIGAYLYFERLKVKELLSQHLAQAEMLQTGGNSA